jgi:transcriptional regulator with XRE-family HTH domain
MVRGEDMDILQRITELREMRGWSINHLAKMSGLSQSTVSNLYNREYAPSISTLESLCSGFGISMAEFFNVNNDAVVLTDEQKKLLLIWSSLSKEQKDTLFSLMKNM